MYYIYHIPNIKIGCTKDLQKRMRDQGFTEWEILEEHTDGWLAGNREIELQKEYGLPVDQVHYMISIQNRRKFTKEEMAKGGRNNQKRFTKEECAKGGRAGNGVPKPWAKFSKSAQIKGASNSGKLKRDLTFDQAQEIRAKYTGKRGDQLKLQKEYGVGKSVIFKIVNNKSYLEP